MSNAYSPITLLATLFVPKGFHICDGSSLKVADHKKLFETIGNDFGGDGRTDFHLPDLSQKSPLEGVSYYIREEPNEEPTIGEIRLFSAETPKQDWIKCDGSLVSINNHTGLYSLLGNQFGGDGRSTFSVPNLSGKEPIENTIYCISTKGSYPSRS